MLLAPLECLHMLSPPSYFYSILMALLLMLASKGRGAAGGPAHTAQDLARSIARELLSPLLDTACCRLASLLRHAFEIAADSQQLLQGDAFDITQ